jgi:hypothetical protein
MFKTTVIRRASAALAVALPALVLAVTPASADTVKVSSAYAGTASPSDGPATGAASPSVGPATGAASPSVGPDTKGPSSVCTNAAAAEVPAESYDFATFALNGVYLVSGELSIDLSRGTSDTTFSWMGWDTAANIIWVGATNQGSNTVYGQFVEEYLC